MKHSPNGRFRSFAASALKGAESAATRTMCEPAFLNEFFLYLQEDHMRTDAHLLCAVVQLFHLLSCVMLTEI